MKIYKIINLFMVFLVLMLTACEPNVDEEHLKNTADVDSIELTATQTTTGGNEITLEMSSPGVSGYWNYIIGKGLTNRKTIVFPVKGTFSFNFVGTLGSEFFEKPVSSVTIDTLDTPVPPEWEALLGSDAIAGKTWVFDGGPAPDGRQWWFMSAPGGPENAWSLWWNAAGDCCPPVDAAGSMTFDLDKGANFTYVSGPGATPQVGIFELDVANQTLQIYNANILGAEEPRGNPDGFYQIISLTDTEMVLYVPNNGGGTGWTWVFKPQ